jgi:glucose-1-phosphate thymidylyltransferase
MEKGEYQLTNALENMKAKGMKFEPGKVAEWLDCGNKNSTVFTNSRILHFMEENGEKMTDETLINHGSIVIQPSFIGKNVKLNRSVVGPYASIGDHCTIENSIIGNCIIQTHTKIKNAVVDNAMIGNHVEYSGEVKDLSIGDYTTNC